MRIRLYRKPRGIAKLIVGRAREVGEHIGLNTDTYPGGMPRPGDIIIDPSGSGFALGGAEAECLYEVRNAYLVPIQDHRSDTVLDWEIRATVRPRYARDYEEFIVYPRRGKKPPGGHRH